MSVHVAPVAAIGSHNLGDDSGVYLGDGHGSAVGGNDSGRGSKGCESGR
jgi:hypothetical protein